MKCQFTNKNDPSRSCLDRNATVIDRTVTDVRHELVSRIRATLPVLFRFQTSETKNEEIMIFIFIVNKIEIVMSSATASEGPWAPRPP